MTSACIPDEDACHRVRNLCVFLRVQKGTPGMTHKGCVLQRVSLDAISDVTVVLGMRQSIGNLVAKLKLYHLPSESCVFLYMLLTHHFIYS